MKGPFNFILKLHLNPTSSLCIVIHNIHSHCTVEMRPCHLTNNHTPLCFFRRPDMPSTKPPSILAWSSSLSLPPASQTSLDERARRILCLCNEHDFASASELIHPAVIVQHDEDRPHPSMAAFLDTWKFAATTMPDFEMHIREAAADEQQRKVWVRSEIRGFPSGVVKEIIDMMTFNEEGLLIRNEDCQRVKRVV